MKKTHIQLTETDKTYLQNLISKGTLPVKTYKRALALLELDEGQTFLVVADKVDATHQTVSVWAQKYNEEGLSFLKDKRRSGRPPELDGTTRAKITALACSTTPEGYSEWSLRLLANTVVELEYVSSISHTEVGRILKKMNSNHT
jgi:putative transposase